MIGAVLSRRSITVTLIVISALTALAAVGARPTSTTVSRSSGGAVLIEQTTYNSISILILGWLLLVAVLAAVASVLYLLNRRQPTRKLLLFIGIAGLVPAILPGVFALIARALLIREPGSTQ